MNHSKNFWLEVEKMCPNYKELSKALKKLGPELYRLG
jgi:predicted metal-dependent hydrolase